jgi:protocatechuate 3,4-dioxygenase beta subunit
MMTREKSMKPNDRKNDEPSDEVTNLLTRRRAMALMGAGLAAVAAACSTGATATTGSQPATSGGSTTGGATTGGTGGTTSGGAGSTTGSTVSCILTPEMTEGPFYIDGEAIRTDITEGLPGTPLRLDLGVADASSCEPIKDAVVEVWHADAAGDYSGFGGGASSMTFLRGGQVSDANGRVAIDTIYPGWYQGRTVHIHVKVHAGGNVVHTGQLFFDDSLTDDVYAASPYDERGDRTTRNDQDGIYSSGGAESTLTVKPSGDGYVGSIVMGVQR